jgi:hypothetical protein
VSINLLIKEIDPSSPNNRYIRENFRRIQQFLAEFEQSTSTDIQVVRQSVQLDSLAGFNKLDSFEVTTNGQTSFTLTETPADDSSVAMLINHAQMTTGVHFTRSGKIITFIPAAAGFTLETVNEFGQPDNVDFYYSI